MTDFHANSIDAVLARVLAGQDAVIATVAANTAAQKERWVQQDQWRTAHELKDDKHEERIGKLENWRWYVLGCVATATIAVGYLVHH